MINEIKKHHLFATPVYRAKIEPHLYNKAKIIKDIESNFAITEDRNKLDGHLSASSYLHMHYDDEDNTDFTSIDLNSLRPIYADYIQKFLTDIKLENKDEEVSFKFEIVNYTASMSNNFMRAHNHIPSSDFALCHYVQFEQGVHSATVFSNPGKYIALHNKDVRKNYYDKLDHTHTENSNYHEFFELATFEDDCFIFPGYLHHEIPRSKHKYNKLRIVVVCNIWMDA
jgi:hypothetical protein